jgi:two-component system sensor histidine kinase RegB
MPFAFDSAHRINLAWLFRLRWGAVLGQVATIGIAHFALGIALPLGLLGAIVSLEVAVNLGMHTWLSRRAAITPAPLAGGLAFDIVILTALLLLSGGPHNPFSFLYLVYIALAAIALPPKVVWGLVSLAAVGSALLFVLPSYPLHIHGGGEGLFNLHLQGMWVAFTVAASFIVFFVMRIRSALAAREEELQQIRQNDERNDKLSALATLAAGAAHELATPLATIATVARELELALQRAHAEPDWVDDARLVRQQVDRCRQVLAQMSADTGATMADSFETMSLGAVMDEVAQGLSQEGGALEVLWCDDAQAAWVRAPRTPLRQALTNLIKNGWDACETAGVAMHVVVQTTRASGVATIAITDKGSGMPPDVAERTGQPFFTTKPVGQGMGLGVFVARSVAERLGGHVSFSSRVGQGTTASLSLPVTDHE